MYVIGFIFSHVSHKNANAEWTCVYNFGIVPGYRNQFGDCNDFKSKAKAWRKLGYDQNEGMVEWQSELQAIGKQADWGNVTRALSNLRVTSRVKDVIWRVLTDQLYAGFVAYEHLSNIHSRHNELMNIYKGCPFCSDVYRTVEMSMKHLLWDCPKHIGHIGNA